jgi:hypothetical protein
MNIGGALVTGGENEYRGSINRGSMSVAINAKGGDFWKIGCH